MNDIDKVPLMFQAQIKRRGKIQYTGESEETQKCEKAKEWVNQWFKGCPPVPKKVTEEDTDIPKWKRRTLSPPSATIEMPRFPKDAQQKEYTFDWRFVTNGGQDDGIIRPVIGAKGIPFFPGSSMKGAFLRACTKQESLKYCGTEGKTETGSKPGCLRFHGGYPTDMSWADKERLIDVIHPQWERQIKEIYGQPPQNNTEEKIELSQSTNNDPRLKPKPILRRPKPKRRSTSSELQNQNKTGSSAKIQISLYKTTFKFAISEIPSDNPLEEEDWKRIWEIWETALEQGIGSRVSAGYGQVKGIKNLKPEQQSKNLKSEIISVYLKGQGVASQLLTNKREFRPNMFKAALRGHTMRLLAGVVKNEETAIKLTNQLWGGTEPETIVGKLGIKFTDCQKVKFEKHNYSLYKYKLEAGKLSIIGNKEDQYLVELSSTLIKLALLLGGFGKSWRRVDHDKFFPEYVKERKFPIGCHWEFGKESQNLYVRVNQLSDVTRFLDKTQTLISEWVTSQDLSTNDYIKDWREVWHKDRVQVWGRIAKNKNNSQAVYYFHNTDLGNPVIKKTDLTGQLGSDKKRIKTKTGRIWHRMYPRYETDKGKIITKGEYIELLTVFMPYDDPLTNEFLNFLDQETDFEQLFGTRKIINK